MHVLATYVYEASAMMLRSVNGTTVVARVICCEVNDCMQPGALFSAWMARETKSCRRVASSTLGRCRYECTRSNMICACEKLLSSGECNSALCRLAKWICCWSSFWRSSLFTASTRMAIHFCRAAACATGSSSVLEIESSQIDRRASS